MALPPRISPIFAPIARMEAIKILIAFAAYVEFKLFKMNTNSAFLNGYLKEKVFMKPPLGFESINFPNYMTKLDKTLYGLKHAPRA